MKIRVAVMQRVYDYDIGLPVFMRIPESLSAEVLAAWLSGGVDEYRDGRMTLLAIVHDPEQVDGFMLAKPVASFFHPEHSETAVATIKAGVAMDGCTFSVHIGTEEP